MKHFFIFIVLSFSIGCSLYSQNIENRNYWFWGIEFEESVWVNDFREPLWRIGTELLIPCGNKLSVGVFVGTSFLMLDGGLLASWRFDNQSRFICGAGYSATYDTPLLRLCYKTRHAWFFSGVAGFDFGSSDANVGLGVGYAIMCGRNKARSTKEK
ncbi:MAG: hypothetical protein MJZ99_07545 [Bacteroidales bacterium]|nr:hypothetical protein [Bacteroidales bacterium]